MEKRMNKALQLTAIALCTAGVLVLLGFVGSLRSTAICEALDVTYKGDTLGLLPESVVRNLVNEGPHVPVGTPLGEIDTRNIEQSIRKLPHVKTAVVYKTIDCRLILELEERIPIARVISRSGTHALMDREGYLLSLSPYRNLRLPVISGALEFSPDMVEARAHVGDEGMDPALEECFHFALKLREDELWTKQFQHIVRDAQGDILVYPQVGSHTINFGNTARLDEKFDALSTFYTQGMDASRWNKYSAINLKYKDQIVCTKK